MINSNNCLSNIGFSEYSGNFNTKKAASKRSGIDNVHCKTINATNLFAFVELWSTEVHQ